MARMTTLLAMVALLISTAANAALEPLINIVEVIGTDIELPAHEADDISVVPCLSCGRVEVTSTADTTFRTGGFTGPRLSLNDLHRVLRNARNPDNVIAYVAYSADTLLITEIVVVGAEQ